MAAKTHLQTIRVLLLGGGDDTRWLLREWLVDYGDIHFQMGYCAGMEDADFASSCGSYDVVVLACGDNWAEQKKLLRKLKARLPATPVVVLGEEGEDAAVEALHSGAQDYLQRGVLSPQLLVRAIRYAHERAVIDRDLLVERNLLSSVFESLPGTVYVKDTEGRYLASNPGHRKRIGEPRLEQVLGRTVHDFCPPEQARLYSELDRRVLDEGEAVHNREELMTMPDGTRRWESITKVPLLMPDGSVHGVVGISYDITDRKLAEEKLKEANAEIEASHQRLVQALADLRRSHDDLQRMQDQMIEAEKFQSVGRLAAGVAHEVKNPLAIIKMGIDYLMRATDSCGGSGRAVLEEMNKAVERAEAVVRELLNFAADRGLDLEVCSVNALVDKALQLVGYSMHKAGIQIERDFAEDLPPVCVDTGKIEQVLVNVLLNSVQAISHDHGRIILRTRCRQAAERALDEGDRAGRRVRRAKREVVVEVEDNGCGIKQEVLHQVFDPFFTTKPTGVGTGLGLSVSRRIMERHQGSMDLVNSPAGGAIAILVFPECTSPDKKNSNKNEKTHPDHR